MNRLLAALLCLAAVATTASAHEYSRLLYQHKYAEAEKAVKAKLAQEPNNAAALVTKIDLLSQSGQDAQIDEAVKLGEQCVAANPQSSICHEAYGSILGIKAINSGLLTGLKLAGTVKESLQKAVELDPKNHSARLALFTFYVQAPGIAGGGKDKAIALTQATFKINKDVATLLQSRLDVKDGKLDKAEAATMALNANGDEDIEELHAGALASIGIQYRDQKRFADSERVLRYLTKLYPNNLGGHTFLGRTLAAAGKHQDAIAEFERALQIDDRASLHYRIALSHAALGDKPKAIAGFEKALAQKARLDKKQREDAEQQLKTLKA